jgi:hypothetical protein
MYTGISPINDVRFLSSRVPVSMCATRYWPGEGKSLKKRKEEEAGSEGFILCLGRASGPSHTLGVPPTRKLGYVWGPSAKAMVKERNVSIPTSRRCHMRAMMYLGCGHSFGHSGLASGDLHNQAFRLHTLVSFPGSDVFTASNDSQTYIHIILRACSVDLYELSPL